MPSWLPNLSSWLTWTSIGIGIVVTLSIFWFSSVILARRRNLAFGFGTEDLPWDELLEMLKLRQGADGELPDAWNDLPSDQLLQLMLQQLAKQSGNAKALQDLDPEEAQYLTTGLQRRAHRRRWLNPTEVCLTTAFQEKPVKGVIINRSEGGLAILTDIDYAVDTLLFVSPAEAPKSLTPATVAVRHSRRAGKLWVIGCQYDGEVPWNVKVWFG